MPRAAKGHQVAGIGDAERRRLAWHLPDDFSRRPLKEQEEILLYRDMQNDLVQQLLRRLAAAKMPAAAPKP